jgi:peptide chain release factor 3
MEKARGISITSAALQFAYGDHVVNLVDTPGHSDFSEDTYRVLSAVDCAVMLIDAAKGLEPQTLKLFRVCKARGIPVITVINKWDRPGSTARADGRDLPRHRLQPTPLTWPVGIAGDFKGVLERRTGTTSPTHVRRAGQAGAGGTAGRRRRCRARRGRLGDRRRGERPARRGRADHDQEMFLDGITTPVLFASAILNFGVAALLETLVELAPPAMPFADVAGERRHVGEPFSAFVFKVQAGMDTNHRDRVAFARVTSGVFERGMVVTHAQSGRPFATKYAQAMFGRERTVLDEAYPGDIIGLVNATSLRPGDTLFLDSKWSSRRSRPSRPSTSRSPRPPTRAVQAVPQGHRPARQRGRRAGAPLRPARQPVTRAGGGRSDAVRGGAGADGERVRRTDPAGAPRVHAGPPYRRSVRGELDAIRSIEVLSRNDGTLLVLAPTSGGSARSSAITPT